MAKCHHESIVLLDDVHHDSFSVITHNSWPHTFPTTKMKNPRGKPLWRPLLFTILFLLITQTNATADSQPQMDSTQTGPSYTLNGLPGENPKLNRSLKLMDMVRQPTINHLKFCGDPPLVPHAQSNLKRNQKHYVFPVGQEASYMCDQGYTAVSGSAITRCISDSPPSHVIFPQSITSLDHRPQVSLLGSGRMKNSKRLFSSDIDEEPDLNANSGHRSFPVIDKRKMSRKSDEDLIGPLYDSNHDPRHSSEFDNDGADYLEKRKKLEKSLTSYYELNNQAARWWPPVTLNCQLVNCTDPGQVHNAKRRDPPTGIFSFNTNVFYECEEGFETIGIPILTCRSNGTWNRQPPKCRLKQCPALPTLIDGRILYSDTERRTDSRAEYFCNPGYRLNALANIRHCHQNDQWSQLDLVAWSGGSNSTNTTDPYRCVPVECPPPTRPHNGLRILAINRKQRVNKYLPGDVIIYSCTVNNVKATAKCRSDGEWSRDAPHCPPPLSTPSRCPPLAAFSHGSVKIDGSKATFVCLNGYELDGASSITCSSNGVWNAAMPRCVLLTTPPTTNTLDHSGHSGVKNELIVDTQKTSKTLTILLTIIAVVVGLIMIAGTALFCRWRQQQIQRKRWQQYFGHYHHRQSKTNIVISNTYNGGGGGGGGGQVNGANSVPLSVAGSSNASSSSPSTKHLLQRQGMKSTSGNHLQSSFSSADDNAPDRKSFNTGTISSDHGQTISTYADDTCPEDDDDDEDLYSNSTILPPINQHGSVFGRQHNSLPPEAPAIMLMTPMAADHGIAKRTLSTGTEHHLYSNLPNSIPLAPMPVPKPRDRLNTVPVTDL